MCETRKSTLRYEHNSNLNYIDNQQDRLVPAIRGFKIASLNITSLPKHIDELRICINDKEIDVLAINETRMDDSVPIESIAIQGYNWISKNRNRSGGGIGFFIRDSINFRPRTDLNNHDIEILTIQISKHNVKPFLITTWYRPPNDPIDTLYRFENCLQLIDNDNKESIILGDSTNKKIPEMKDENGEVIDETLIPNAFNKYFVELGGKLANKIPQSNILPDRFPSDVHHPANGFPSFQEISENDVLTLLHGLGPNKASGIDDKIATYGIKGTAHRWLESYLSNRTQCCCVNGKLSSPSIMKTGIPQRSGLGPLLFLIYINDLPKCLNAGTKPDMFADDTQIATSTDDIKVITETLNRDLNNVANWLSANKLTLNNSKTEYMIIGSKKRLSQVTADPAISIGNLEIKRVEMTKSLGLMIDESLDWTAQVEHISKKVNLLTRRKPKKAVQHAAQNITWSNPGAESADWSTPTSRLVTGRRDNAGEERERRMARNNLVNLVAPRVGSGVPRLMCQERFAGQVANNINSPSDNGKDGRSKVEQNWK
ncbi:Hypothetical predicted protein [Paramuricea clavata]|uniref:Reverse transcriptase domain-containing protein n=1 Tax=Paramuricea clavata TaxID=317549 RepID=A0A7D9DWY5_PARCT|nr:Hypothetical predicted protein [Paramuricea clavata]